MNLVKKIPSPNRHYVRSSSSGATHRFERGHRFGVGKTVKVIITGGTLRALTGSFKDMIIDRANRNNDRTQLVTESA